MGSNIDELKRNAVAFLGEWNLSLDSLLSFAPHVEDNECLVLCSTIPEGLANQASDIDMMYVGSSALKGGFQLQSDTAHQMDVAHDPDGHEINVTKVSSELLDELARTLSLSLSLIDNPRSTKGIVVERDPRRLVIAHRLLNSVPLINSNVHAQWKDKLHLDRLHTHLCFQSVADYLNLAEDVVGELEAGFTESATWIARSMMAPKLVGALLYSIGLTNPSQKWHMKLIHRHKDEIGAHIVDRLVDFIWDRPPVTGSQLRAQILDACEPAITSIYARDKKIHRAAYKFTHAVRYLSISKAKV